MTRRNLKITIAVVLVLFVAFEIGGSIYAEKHKNDISSYEYEGKLLLAEGGFEKARAYADSIFSNSVCSEAELVYADALKEHDFPKKKLMYSVFKRDSGSNSIYFVYRVPNIVDNDGELVETFEYSENDSSLAILEFVNVKRENNGVYHCDNFNVYDFENADKGETAAKEALAANQLMIEPDAEVKSLCDYGVLYCDDSVTYSEVYEYERQRISSFLLSKQEEYYSSPEFTTSAETDGGHNAQPLVKDAPIYISDDSEKDYKSMKLDFETGVDEIFRGKKYIDYSEYNEKALEYNTILEEKRRVENESKENELNENESE